MTHLHALPPAGDTGTGTAPGPTDWPRLDSEGRCSLCRERHDTSPREHHRADLADGRYSDEMAPWPATGVAAPVDPESGGVHPADLARAIADRLHGATPTPSGWVELAGSVVGDRVLLRVTTWGPASQLCPRISTTHPLDLGEALP